MARKGRSGFRTPELRGTLGTLFRTTREVLERGAREGRERIDEALAGRKRTDALAELGEIVLDLVRRGEIDIDELPEAREAVAHLDELDAGAEPEPPPPRDIRGRRRAEAEVDDVARAPVRSRFDTRSREDGTVSSKTWSPPSGRVGSGPTRGGAAPAPGGSGPAKVWRPPAHSLDPVAPLAEPTIVDAPKPTRKGGITFDSSDDDSDLADYMHPDDVPPKPPASGSDS